MQKFGYSLNGKSHLIVMTRKKLILGSVVRMKLPCHLHFKIVAINQNVDPSDDFMRNS